MSLYGHTRPNEQKAFELLADTDWTQLPDSGLTDACIAKFVTYRTSLREIRRSDGKDVTFPTLPKEEWK